LNYSSISFSLSPDDGRVTFDRTCASGEESLATIETFVMLLSLFLIGVTHMVDLFAFGDSAGDYFITKRTTPECEDDRGFEELFAALNVNRLEERKAIDNDDGLLLT
jgi:hypothetical protein